MIAEGLQRASRSTAGKVVTVGLIVLVVLGLVYVVRSALKSDTPDIAFSTMYIDTENGKPFLHENQRGETPPIISPYSGKPTGVRAEACYWTASGGIKKDPTWVLLNDLAGKPGPTFCPDCGRLVVGHNPVAVPGMKPPPTRQEYEARHPAHTTGAPAGPGARDSR